MTRHLTAPEIAEDLAARIRAGEHQPGTQLHYGELAERYGVRSWTIKRAMVPLRTLGLVEDRQGIGVFVADPLP